MARKPKWDVPKSYRKNSDFKDRLNKAIEKNQEAINLLAANDKGDKEESTRSTELEDLEQRSKLTRAQGLAEALANARAARIEGVRDIGAEIAQIIESFLSNSQPITWDIGSKQMQEGVAEAIYEALRTRQPKWSPWHEQDKQQRQLWYSCADIVIERVMTATRKVPTYHEVGLSDEEAEAYSIGVSEGVKAALIGMEEKSV